MSSVMKGGSCCGCAEAGLVCEHLRRKRGRPRKVKPDPNAPKPTPPKPLPTLRPTPVPYGHLPVAPPPRAFAPRHPTPLAATTTTAVGREKKRWAGGGGNCDCMDDEQEEEEERQVAGPDRVRVRGEELRPPTAANSGVVPSVLQLLVNELQDMKHSVDAMKKDVSRLSAKQRTYTNMQHDLTQRLDSLPAIVPPMAPARSELLVPRPTDSARAARLEFLRQFPFLERYNLATRDVPFIVDDLRKPFAILRFLPATHWERGVPLPIMVYASASFCELTQYELHELQGCPPVHLGVPDRTQHGQLIQNITHRTYADITDTIQVHPLMRTKNGNIIKTTLRHQAFFDDDGDISWVMVCIDSAEPARGDEVPHFSLAHGGCTDGMSHEDVERAKKILFPTLSPT